MPRHQFDVVVIGAGPGGEIISGRLAERGKRVAVVERHLIGGECSFYACMPSKALLRPAELLAEVERVPGAAEAVTGELDVEATLRRRDEVISSLDDSHQVPWLEDRGIVIFRGQGRLEGERTVRVGDDLLEASDAVVIATGTGSAMPPIPGLAEAAAWSNREITTAEEVPGRLVILGGGVVGSEMAQAWASLGSQVTLIEGEERLISREETFASEELQEALEAAGVAVRTGALATAVERDGDTVSVELDDGSSVSGDQLVVAVGRKPHTDEIGLDSVGLEPGGMIDVDDRMRVPGHDWLYAVGDVNGRSLLTHSGKLQARVAADVICGEDAISTDGPGSPRVIFTDPQIAAVGETLAAAEERGANVVAIDLKTSMTAGASFHGRNAPGTTRFVIDTDRDVIAGATIVGADVADLLQPATIAVVAEVPMKTLAHAIAPFPTRSELWLKLIEAYEKERGLSLHTR